MRGIRIIYKLKNFITNLFSFKVPLDRRISFAMILCGTVGCLSGFVESIMVEMPFLAQFLHLISAVFLIILLVWGYCSRHNTLFSFITIAIFSWFLFPAMLFANGGFSGGMPFYLLISSICIALALKGKLRIILFVITLIENLCLGIFYFNFPQYFIEIESITASYDICTSLTISYAIIFFFAYIVSKQNTHDRAQIEYYSELYEKQANTDELTQLYNRRYFKNFLELAFSSLGDSGNLHIVMFDLDDFKYVNDKFGHLAGDHILVQFSEILKAECKNGIVACRYGGEEFMLIIPSSDRQSAIAVAERIRTKTSETIFCEEKHPITVSAGFVTYTNRYSYESVLEAVDKNLYTAKKTGKNKIIHEILDF